MSPRARNGKAEPEKKKPAARPPRARTKGKAADPPETSETPVPPKDDGAAKKRLTMVEKLRLVERIQAARTKPKPDTWPVIAKREGIPQRTIQFIYAQFQGQDGKLADATGTKVLRETLHLYEAAIEKLAYEAEFGETGAIRVGAIRQMLDALKGRVELLAVMGRMPRSFRAMDELVALQRLTRGLAEIVEQHALPAEIVAEFLALADEVQPVIDGTGVVRELPRAS